MNPSPELVIADSGPLIALSRVVELSLLRDVFGQVWLTETVLAECTVRLDRQEGVLIRAAEEAGWLKVRPDSSTDPNWDLDPGEVSAIAAALELRAGLLMDDRMGRRVAGGLGLPVIGALGVLVRAKRMGRLPSIRPLVEELVASRYFLADKVVEEVLRLVGE